MTESAGRSSQPPPSDGAASQAGLLVWGTTLSTLTSAIVPFVVLRALGKGDVATLAALSLAYDTLALFLTSGFPQTLMYHLPGKSVEERRATAWRIIRTLMTLGAGVGVLLVLFSFGIGESLFRSDRAVDMSPLILMAPVGLFELPTRLMPTLFVVEKRARYVPYFAVVRSIFGSAGILVPVALGASIWTIVAVKVILDVCYGTAFLLVVRRIYAPAKLIPAPVRVRELFRFALPLGATDAVSMVNQQLDRYLILLSFPAAAFAGYHAAAWQIPIISTVPYAVGTAFQPKLVELYRKQDPRGALDIWRHSTLKVSLIVVPVVMVFIIGSEEAMWLLGGEAYVSSGNVFRAYSFLTLARVATFGSVLVAAGRPRMVLYAALVTLVSNVCLSVPLLFVMGWMGPAVGTALAFIPMAVAYCYFIAKVSEQPLSHTFPLLGYLKVLAVAVLAGAPALWLKLSFDWPAPLRLIAVALVELGLFAIVGTLLGLIKSEDWKFVRRWLRGKLSSD